MASIEAHGPDPALNRVGSQDSRRYGISGVLVILLGLFGFALYLVVSNASTAAAHNMAPRRHACRFE